MEDIKIWEGYKGTNNGVDDSDFVTVEFRGEEIGCWRTLYGGYDEERGTTVRVFRTDENTVVVHRVEWSNYDGGEHNAYIYEYDNLEQAAADGWRRLFQNMNLIERDKISLKEWRERKRKK